MTNVLFLAHSDYGNSGALFARALESTGRYTTRGFVQQPHPFEYPGQFEDIDGHDPSDLIAWADVVHVVQSDLPACMGGQHPPYWWKPDRDGMMVPLIDFYATDGDAPGFTHDRLWRERKHRRERSMWLRRLRHKVVVVQHGNSYCRQQPSFYRWIWEGIADAHVMHEGDLMRLGFPNEHLILPPVDTGAITPPPIPSERDRLVVGHFPSSMYTKGTPEIRMVMAGFPSIDFRTSPLDMRLPTGVETVSHAAHLWRMSECDVIIDQIKPTLGGRPFGEWCSTACESAALGRVTIANSHTVDLYRQAYGEEPMIWIANTPRELLFQMECLGGIPRDLLAEQQALTREWVVRCHSIEATGLHYHERVLAPLLEKCAC